MTTERLSILAAAIALKEFTTSELTAFTGANPHTVRQVLYREQGERDLFERRQSERGGTGRRPLVWRIKDPDAVFREIEADRRAVAELPVPDRGGPGPASRDVLLASAEEAVARSCESADGTEQRALAAVAVNLLKAADPRPALAGLAGQAEPHVPWWERAESHRGPLLPDMPPRDSAVDERQLGMARRAAAFAALAARRASGLPIEARYLRRACNALALSAATLPRAQADAWLRRIVRIASTEAGYLPPVAVLMRPAMSPTTLFPVARSPWRCVRAQASLVRPRYALWAEDWAAGLLTADIMPLLVVAHDDSLEAANLVDLALADAQNSGSGPATLVASLAEDLQTVARVVQGVGHFYPLREAGDGLPDTLWRLVAKGVGIPPASLVGTAFALKSSQSSPSRRYPDRSRENFHSITAARAVNFSYSELREWTRKILARPGDDDMDLVVEERSYTFNEILELKIVKLLDDNGVAEDTIRSAVSVVRDVTEDRADITIICDQAMVYWLSGQGTHAVGPDALRISVGKLIEEAEYALGELKEELERRLRSVAQSEFEAARRTVESMRYEIAAILDADRGTYRAVAPDIVKVAA